MKERERGRALHPHITGYDSVDMTRVPEIDIRKLGDALAVWEQAGGAHTDVWANRFESDNP
jgi:hypothetical protein